MKRNHTMKKIKWAAAALLTVLCLSACGGSKSADSYALITGPGGADADTALSAIEDGMEDYASENKVAFQTYTAATMDTSDYLKAIDQAVSDKADCIVLCGEEFEKSVYEAQKSYKDVKFLFFGGEPRANEDSNSSIRSNTLCIDFKPEDQGFLAGYSIVMDDFWYLGVLGGKQSDYADKVLNGFIQGAETAAKDREIESGNVNILFEFAGTDALTPLRTANALDLYNENSRSVLLTIGDNVRQATYRAAESTDDSVITVGKDYREDSDRVRFSVVPNYYRAVQAAMETTVSGFKGGQTVKYGMAERALSLAADFDELDTYTLDEYNDILTRTANGNIEITPDIPETTLVSVNEITVEKDEEEQAESGAESGAK